MGVEGLGFEWGLGYKGLGIWGQVGIKFVFFLKCLSSSLGFEGFGFGCMLGVPVFQRVKLRLLKVYKNPLFGPGLYT